MDNAGAERLTPHKPTPYDSQGSRF